MSGMIKYEWKKIWTSRLTQISVIGCSLFLVFCVCSSIFQITATDENGQTVSGMTAVEVLQNTQQRQELTQDRVNEIVDQYWNISRTQIQAQTMKHTIICPKKNIVHFICQTKSC